jgi:hypothetical protein
MYRQASWPYEQAGPRPDYRCTGTAGAYLAWPAGPTSRLAPDDVSHADGVTVRQYSGLHRQTCVCEEEIYYLVSEYLPFVPDRRTEVRIGFGMFIPDTNFSIPDPASRVKKIQDPRSGSASKNLSIFSPKAVSKLSEK